VGVGVEVTGGADAGGVGVVVMDVGVWTVGAGAADGSGVDGG
jgi:hypothetical protein